ncbi:MAG: methyltransferase [Erysipelotrichales bacterium]
MKQYFVDDIELEDKPLQLEYDLNGEKLIFETNAGLFSRNEIDEFSETLVNNIEINKYNKILDLGCGYGFIGITLSKLVEYQDITFIDITSRACLYTSKNIINNKVSNYEVIQSDGIQNNTKYDLITLNPPIHAGKEIVYQLYKNALDHLSEDGSFYIVLHKKHGAKSTLTYLAEEGYNTEVVYKKKSLYVIKLTTK